MRDIANIFAENSSYKNLDEIKKKKIKEREEKENINPKTLMIITNLSQSMNYETL